MLEHVSDNWSQNKLVAAISNSQLPQQEHQRYSDITHLAAFICDTPVALISIATDTQMIPLCPTHKCIKAAPKQQTFCVVAMEDPTKVYVVENATTHPRFMDHPLVSGEPRFQFYAGASLIDADGQVLGTICVFDFKPKTLNEKQTTSLQALSRQVIALFELQRLSESLHQKSMTDALTNLPNRRAFDQRLSAEFNRMQRNHSSFVLAVIDVDHFKSFNDNFGHAQGDEALKSVALILQTNSRDYDFVARYGGEEFAVIMPDCEIDAAYKKIERLRLAIEQAIWLLRGITISAGLAAAQNYQTQQLIFAAADQALYQAKTRGRNQLAISATD